MSVIGVVDAAAELGVSPRRVRQMLADRALEGERVGRAWVVDRSALGRAKRPAAGRPWRAASAWGLLALASGEDVAMSAVERSRAGRRLEEVGLVGLVPKLSSRADVRRFYVHPSVLEPLGAAPGVVRSGVSAAVEHEIDLVAVDRLEAYVAESSLPALVGRFALEQDAERPNVILRVVVDEVWPFGAEVDVAPAAVVAVDLLEADDDRSRRAGAELVQRL